jgi:hypothetical protein
VLHLDINTRAAKHKVKLLLDTWIRNGALRVEIRTDPTRRTEHPYVVVGGLA